MTVSVATARVAYSGSGTTGPFSIPFYFLENSHIKAVKLDANSLETILVLTTDYTLTGAGDEDGGTLTLVSALASGETLTITRNVPITQETDWPVADPFPAASHEDAADKLTMIVQQINDTVGRTLRQPVSDTTAIGEMPIASSRANMALTFDADGDPLMADISGNVIAFTPTTEAFDGDGTTVAFTLAAAPSTASALIVRIDGVVQTPITDFSVSGTTLTFTTAPATGTGNVVVQNFGIAAVVDTVGVDNVTGLSASTGASKVGFVQSGSGAQATTMQTKARQVRSVFDYLTAAQIADVIAKTYSLDLTTALQAAIDDALTTTGGGLYWPNGSYKITAELEIPSARGWKMFGESRYGVTIKQDTDNTPIFSFRTADTAYFSLTHFTFDYTNVQDSSDTAAIPIFFDLDNGTPANGFYNFEMGHLTFLKGYYPIASTTAAKVSPVWGGNFHDLNVWSDVSGGVIRLAPGTAAGQPNNSLRNIYVRADNLSTTMFRFAAATNTFMDNVEINNTTGTQVVYVSGNGSLNIGTIRIENGSLTSNNVRLFQLDSAGLISIENLLMKTLTLNVANWVYVIGGTTGSGAHCSVEHLEITSITVTSGNIAVSSARDGCFVTVGTITNGGGSYALPTNVSIANAVGTTAEEYTNVISWATPRVVADNGDAAATLTWGSSRPTQIWATPIAADRAVTLSTTNVVNGARFHIVRAAAATGAFNLNVGTGPLKALGIGEWCDVEYNGSAWVLTAYGAL